jgi:hypothetical protein
MAQNAAETKIGIWGKIALITGGPFPTFKYKNTVCVIRILYYEFASMKLRFHVAV